MLVCATTHRRHRSMDAAKVARVWPQCMCVYAGVGEIDRWSCVRVCRGGVWRSRSSAAVSEPSLPQPLPAVPIFWSVFLQCSSLRNVGGWWLWPQRPPSSALPTIGCWVFEVQKFVALLVVCNFDIFASSVLREGRRVPVPARRLAHGAPDSLLACAVRFPCWLPDSLFGWSLLGVVVCCGTCPPAAVLASL